MEPISIALTAFSAIKAGVAAGKEIHSLASDIGQLWDAIDNVKSAHNKKRNSPVTKLKGVNQEALETFIAVQKAKDMEEELREIIIYTRGMDAWQELLRLRSQIAKDRKDSEKALIRKRQKRQEDLMIWASVTLGIVVVLGSFLFLYWAINNR